MMQNQTRSTPNPPSPAPPRPGRNLRTAFLSVLILAAVAVTAFTVANRVQNARFENDSYLRANDLYKQAFADYQRGGMDGYRTARAKLLQALELQKNPDGSKQGTPPFYANALTHNACGLLAILSALIGDCAEYEKYKNFTAAVARSKWTIDVMNDVQEQVNEEEKTQLVFSAEQQISEAGARCRDTGLPVKSPEPENFLNQ